MSCRARYLFDASQLESGDLLKINSWLSSDQTDEPLVINWDLFSFPHDIRLTVSTSCMMGIVNSVECNETYRYRLIEALWVIDDSNSGTDIICGNLSVPIHHLSEDDLRAWRNYFSVEILRGEQIIQPKLFATLRGGDEG